MIQLSCVQVTDKMREVRQSLADCVFCWACQTPLDRPTTLHLLAHLRGVTPAGGVAADGALDGAQLAALMAALYSLDVSALQEHDAEGG